MGKDEHIDLGSEIAKIHPVILREVTKRQMMGGMSLPQIVILDLLNGKGPCKMGELAVSLKLTLGAVTGIVDRIIAMKLVDILKQKGHDVKTEIKPAGRFWPAEESHQDYYNKNDSAGDCHTYTKRFCEI